MTMTIQALVSQLVATLFGSEDDVYDRNYAVGLVTEFNDDASKTGAWTGLTKAAFCARLSELIAKPYLLNQGGTSFCAPAAVLYVFAMHYPRKFADFAMRLFATGTTSIGTRTIEMTSGIRETDLTTWIASTTWAINVTDLLLILAIQEDMTFLDIDGPGDYALAPPFVEDAYTSDVKATLGGSGLFEIEDLTDTAAAIKAADLPERTHVILVGGMSMFSKKSAGRHAAVLAPPLTIEGSSVTFRFWSWGTFENHNTFPVVGPQYREHSMSVSSFNATLDAAIRVTAIKDDI